MSLNPLGAFKMPVKCKTNDAFMYGEFTVHYLTNWTVVDRNYTTRFVTNSEDELEEYLRSPWVYVITESNWFQAELTVDQINALSKECKVVYSTQALNQYCQDHLDSDYAEDWCLTLDVENKTLTDSRGCCRPVEWTSVTDFIESYVL